MIATTAALKRLICRVLIGVLVWTQLALAAYACPGFRGAGSEATGMSTMQKIGDAVDPDHGMAAVPSTSAPAWHPGMDTSLPNLCNSHCQLGQQKADHTPSPAVSPALLVGLYTLVPLDRAAEAASTGAFSAVNGPPVPADPPHAILHCCFRD